MITSARHGGLRIRLDGEKHPVPIHPTWEVVYLPDTKDSSGPRVWRAGDPEPAEQVVVRDCHGDLWSKAGDFWETPETAPFRWATVAKKWGPLTEVPGERWDGAGC